MAANKDCDVVWNVEEEVILYHNILHLPTLHRCFTWNTRLLLDVKNSEIPAAGSHTNVWCVEKSLNRFGIEMGLLNDR